MTDYQALVDQDLYHFPDLFVQVTAIMSSCVITCVANGVSAPKFIRLITITT